jgi:hypothetical protein
MQDTRQATNRQEPQHYEIRVRGVIGPTIRQAFPALTAERRGEDTILSGRVQDQSALYGVLHELEALSVELIELRRRTSDESGDGEQSTGDAPARVGSSRASV